MADLDTHLEENGNVALIMSNSSNDHAASRDASPSSYADKPKKSRYPGFIKCRPVDAPIERVDRHRFGAPLKFQKPNPSDLTYWQALAVVEDSQNDRPFEKFANQLHLSALNCAPTIFNACDTVPVVHALYQDQRVIKIQLKLTCDIELGWAYSTVMLRDGDRWIPLHEYLKSLAVPEHSTTGQVGWWVQQKWWKSLGKPFRLLDLPEELRRIILLYAMGEQVYPRPPDYMHDQLSLTQGFRRYESSDVRSNIPPTNVSVLCLNRELAAVARDLLWGETTKVYHQADNLPSLSSSVKPSSVKPPQCFRFIRRMKLALIPRALFRIFRVEVVPFTRGWHDEVLGDEPPAGEIFQHLPCLKYVEFEVFLDSWQSTSWDDSTGYWDPFDDSTIARADPGSLFCSEIFLNIVMAFAAEYLKRVKTVRVSGRVKLGAKKRWDDMLNFNAYDVNEPALELLKHKARMVKVGELPLMCPCDENCNTYDFSYGKSGITYAEDGWVLASEETT